MKKTKEVEAKANLNALFAKYRHPKNPTFIRTGIHALDLMIGGGIPLGRIIEIFGGESAGKSLMAWTIAKAFQKVGGVVILLDMEATAPADFMKAVGVDTEQVIEPPEPPRTIEECRDWVVKFITEIRALDKDVPILIIWDTIASSPSEGEFEDIDKQKTKESVAAQARAISQFFRHFTIYLSEQNATLLCVNQLREKIGVRFGKKTDSPGGKALKFYASVRIELSKGAPKKVNDVARSYTCYASIPKNKVNVPFRSAELQVILGQGYNPVGGLMDLLEQAGRLKKSPKAFKVGETEYQKSELQKAIDEHPELLNDWMHDPNAKFEETDEDMDFKEKEEEDAA